MAPAQDLGEGAPALHGPEPPIELADGVRAAWALLHACASSIDGLSVCLAPDSHPAQLEVRGARARAGAAGVRFGGADPFVVPCATCHVHVHVHMCRVPCAVCRVPCAVCHVP
eukprot:3829656-Prymnesium_polylepis.1